MVRCEQLAIYLIFYENVSDEILDQQFTYSGMGHISQGDRRNLATVESDLADLGQKKERCYTVSVVEASVHFQHSRPDDSILVPPPYQSINQLNNEQKT